MDAARYKTWQNALANLTPIAKTTTDADGNYSLAITSRGAVYLCCVAKRQKFYTNEYNIWAVPIAESGRLDLNNQNRL